MFMVVLAQLVEHRIVVPSVVGSSPTFHPKQRKYHLVSPLFFLCGCTGENPFYRGPRRNLFRWGERVSAATLHTTQ